MASIFELLGLTGKKIKVTPNVEHCLDIFKKTIETLPEGESKQEAEGALDYLSKTVKGEKQPMKGIFCGTKVIIPPTEE